MEKSKFFSIHKMMIDVSLMWEDIVALTYFMMQLFIQISDNHIIFFLQFWWISIFVKFRIMLSTQWGILMCAKDNTNCKIIIVWILFAIINEGAFVLTCQSSQIDVNHFGDQNYSKVIKMVKKVLLYLFVKFKPHELV